MMLESKGFEVGKAYDGLEGEAAIKQRRPDVLIVKIRTETRPPGLD